LSRKITHVPQISRRSFIQGSAAAALVHAPVLGNWSAKEHPIDGKGGPARHILSLDQDWLFGGKLNAAALDPGFDDAVLTRVTLPHCVTPLSWQKWDPSTWEDIWLYRRHFSIPPELSGLRLFLHINRIMVCAKPVLNGQTLSEHLGGFLPFEYEITRIVKEKDNVLSIAVDSRWQNVPPAGSPKGPSSIDYLLPGGICGSVSLRALPHVFISDVFAKPVSVLDSNRRLEINCRVDAGITLPASILLVANLRDGDRTVASASKNVNLEGTNEEVSLTLNDLKNITLWGCGKASSLSSCCYAFPQQ
jgi:beta-galactosidase